MEAEMEMEEPKHVSSHGDPDIHLSAMISR